MAKKQIKIPKTHKEIIELIECSILNYVFRQNHENMSNEVFKIFLNVIGISGLDDYACLKDNRIRKLIDWSKVPKKKIIRLITRDTSLIDEINFEFQKFSIIELEFFLKFHPEYISKLNVDFENITSKECLILLNIDKNAYKYIDFDKVVFNRIETQSIVKKFIYDDAIIERLNFETMDNFIQKNIFKKTGDKYLSKINLEKFNVLDWLDLLQSTPSLFKYCNLDLFATGDCYYLTKLAKITNEPIVFQLIEKHKNDISALGWQNLLIIDFNKYSPICNWAILKNVNYKSLKKIIPDIEKHKLI